MASQVAAANGFAPPAAGLVFFGYPLHPPEAPTKRRDAHLPRIDAPMLFIHGTRDPFGTPDEMRELTASLPTSRLHLVEGGDHSLQRSKRGESVDECAFEVAAEWIKSLSRYVRYRYDRPMTAHPGSTPPSQSVRDRRCPQVESGGHLSGLGRVGSGARRARRADHRVRRAERHAQGRRRSAPRRDAAERSARAAGLPRLLLPVAQVRRRPARQPGERAPAAGAGAARALATGDVVAEP